MSELKATRITMVYDGEVYDDFGTEPFTQLYHRKSEADKVIADRDYEIDKLKESISNLLKMNTEQVMAEVMKKALIYGEGFVSVEHAMKLVAELRHQKYKRCLAVARRCHNESLWWYSKGYGFEKYDKFWEKWEKRWLELAEKFKETK